MNMTEKYKKEPESSASLFTLVIKGHLSQLSGGSNRMELKWPQAGLGAEQCAEEEYKRVHEDPPHSLIDFLEWHEELTSNL